MISLSVGAARLRQLHILTEHTRNTAGKSQSRKVAARSTMPPTPRRKAAQARLIAAKEQLKKRAQRGAVDAPALGSLPVLTPVRATKKEEKLHGTAFMVTPVRRSGRKTPSK